MLLSEPLIGILNSLANEINLHLEIAISILQMYDIFLFLCSFCFEKKTRNSLRNRYFFKYSDIKSKKKQLEL